MELDAKLDLNVVAVDSGETVHLLLELEAPGLEGERRRDPANLQVVLDRSGSMGGGSLVSALQAIYSLIGKLGPEDNFGLVCFDNDVSVPVAAGAVGSGQAIRSSLRHIHPGGMTNLGDGLIRGVQEAARVNGDGSTNLVLLSDGHANRGTTEHGALEQIARTARNEGIEISTIGIGHGYDEDLLEAITRGGGGNSHFARNGDEAGAHLAGEVEGLLEQTVQAVSLIVRPSGEVSGVRLYNDLPVTTIEGGFMVEVGSLLSQEKRRLLFEIDVPDIATLGLAQVCEMELRWVESGTMKSKLLKFPVNVNVVPGDQAAGRIPDPTVETELHFQQAQRARKEASDALARGDQETAERIFIDSRRRLSALDQSRMSEQERLDIHQEINSLGEIAAESRRDMNHARKRSMSEYHRKNRRRGRDSRE